MAAILFRPHHDRYHECISVPENGTFDCSFDDDNLCGYRDVSDGPFKWIRSRQHSYTKPGYVLSYALCRGFTLG